MSEDMLAILETKETIFFSREGEMLRQWILVTVENRSDQTVSGAVTITAGSEEVVTLLEISPGVREYRCYAATLWPDGAPVEAAPVRLAVRGEVVTSTVPVGHHRPWKIYLLSDVCTDYTWVYDNVDDVHTDDAAITEAEIVVAEDMVGCPEADCNHYNFVHAREVEFYLELYPDRAERLFGHIRKGTITLNPLYNMCLTGDMSLEELIRHLYRARGWAMEHDLDMGYANHQETPAIAWAMVPVLAGSGVDHLVKSILPYECPWAERLEEPPVYIWEGRDGSRILVRLRKTDYVEGRFVLRHLRATNSALHHDVIPRYEELGEVYPFDAVALVGCYGDLSPRSKDLPALKAATISEYNDQDWAYPKLVNASHKQFWDDVDGQIAARATELPVYRGDYGTGWETWPASLAYDFAGWRRAQERAGTADKLTTVLSRLDGDWFQAHYEQLATGWMNLIYLADHAWNGSNDANLALNASLRRQWQESANQAFDAVIADGLGALSSLASGQSESKNPRVVLFNGLGWSRAGVVQVDGVEGDAQIIDTATGESMATQVEEEDGRSTLYFQAPDVPSVGYRVFDVRPGEPPAQLDIWKMESNKLEGPFYAIEVSPVTGGIVSLYDKVRGKELVDPDSPYHLNQCLYWSDGTEHTPQAARTEIGSCGAVFGQLIVRSTLKNTRVKTTITLYAYLDRVDICNEVEKEPTAEKQELDFAFPFQVSDREYRFEAPGAIITPGVDQRPGAGQAVTAVRHFVDVFNDEFGVTLSQADSGLIEFGYRTTAEDPLEPDPANSTILALALENCIDWHESIRDQAGVSRFLFRYSLRGHAGGFDPAAAVRFGWEDNNELLSRFVDKETRRQGDLPSDVCSFLSVDPDNVILTTLKMAEEEGLIVRLWECAGRDTEAVVHVSGLDTLRGAWLTDLLERDEKPLTVADGQVTVPVRAYGLTTIRLLSE